MPSGCWLWQGACGGHWQPASRGYSFSAKRLIVLLGGGVPSEVYQHIRPVCGARLCVNPAHTVSGASARFWSKVCVVAGSCWEWIGALSGAGYGDFHIGEGSLHTLAHRFSFELHNGEIPDGLIVMHTCDNPCCVNPEHLRLGTMADNQCDMAQKGRSGMRGERCPWAKLTDAYVREIRAAVGVTNCDLARRYNISPSAIRNVRGGRAWRHIQ